MIRNVIALTQRELATSFLSPVAYIVSALFLVALAFLFTSFTLIEGAEATMQVTLDWMAKLVLVLAIPLLTMRTLSDEFANGTIETLMTAPVSDVEVVIGKFLGVLALYVAMLLTTLVHVGLLLAYGSIDMAALLYAYLGMILLGGMYVSVGVFTSSLTRHQLLAALMAIAVLAIFGVLIDEIASWAAGPWRVRLSYLNVIHHFEDFTRGIFDTKAIVFFLSSTLFFLFLSVKVLESRRWR